MGAVLTGVAAAALVLATGAALDVARRRTRRWRARRRFASVPAGHLRSHFTTPNLRRLALAIAPPRVHRLLHERAAVKAEADLPGVLEAVARGLRTGASLRQALTEAAASAPGLLGDELAEVALVARRGVPLVGALEAWEACAPRTGVRLAVAALCLGAETGGAQARAVDGVAATLRERLAVTNEVRALSSQTRASMLVIAVSPLAFCAFASATDPRTSTFLFRSPIGIACLIAGLFLDAVGALWMRRLCRVAA